MPTSPGTGPGTVEMTGMTQKGVGSEFDTTSRDRPFSSVVLATPDVVDAFLAVLSDSSGNLSEACRAVGISRMALYRHRQRDPEFAGRVDRVLTSAIRERACLIAMRVDEHIEMHLANGWDYKRDARGDFVLDDNFEKVRVSLIPLRDLNGTRREMRSALEGPAVPSVTNVSIRSSDHVTRETHEIILVGPDGCEIRDDMVDDAEWQEVNDG